MASRWALLRAAVTNAIEALTPETDANVVYHGAESDAVLQGASGRRAFWHQPPSATLMQQQDSSTITVRYEWTLILLLSRGVATIPEFAEACVTEPLNIARAVTLLAPTTGAQPVLVTAWRPTTLGDADEVQIEIDMVSEIDEVL